MLKFEVSRGPGRPVEWTGVVPTASLAHSPGLVFERAVKLSGRVGTEPLTSARTSSSAGMGDGYGVSLEVAMVFRPKLLGGCWKDRGSFADVEAKETMKTHGIATTTRAALMETLRSSFHLDVRRIPCEAGELVVHCLRARNLRVPPWGKGGVRDINPKLSLTTVPEGGKAATSVHAGGGRHPVWGQVRTT